MSTHRQIASHATTGTMSDEPSQPVQPSIVPTRRTALLRAANPGGHDTGTHPENPFRLVAIDQELQRQRLIDGRPAVTVTPATQEAVERVHDAGYVRALRGVAAGGGGWLDADTLVAPDSVDVALDAAGAAIAGVDAALSGQSDRSFALVRPPGHHATPARGMGFCLLNSVAIAAAHALSQGLERILIVDWDVHHGNGTQDAFVESDRVLFCSIHQSPLYPGTGAATERGIGRGTGFTRNVPLPPGRGDREYLRAFDDQIAPLAEQYRPELVLISAGFDAHIADPIGGMRLSEAGFAALATRVVDLAVAAPAGGKVVAVLEGGYDPAALGRSVAAVLRVLDGDATHADRETREQR
jgi:acetoin utilization deacetylase AcuC-like enzyme